MSSVKCVFELDSMNQGNETLCQTAASGSAGGEGQRGTLFPPEDVILTA